MNSVNEVFSKGLFLGGAGGEERMVGRLNVLILNFIWINNIKEWLEENSRKWIVGGSWFSEYENDRKYHYSNCYSGITPE